MLIWPWEDRNRRFSWLKASSFALMLLPAVRSAYLVGAGDYGNSLTVVLEGLTYWSGVWATVILLMALAVTLFATIFRWPAVYRCPAHDRRLGARVYDSPHDH